MSKDDENSPPGYEVVRGLSAGPTTSVLLARHLASGRTHVVKVYRPVLLIDEQSERLENRKRVETFKSAAKMQQGLAASASRWAPIFEFGSMPGPSPAAFYSTEEYPASVAWLVRGRVSLNSATLRRLIVSVIEAIAEVQRCCSRGHGNLTATNVLLSHRDPRIAQVALTDLLPDGVTAADADVADDRWAVGALIYALVTHRVVRRMTLLPVAADEDWKSLGHDGAMWLGLCNQLLSREANQRPELSAVVEQLAPPKAGAARRWAGRAAVATAALAAAAGVGLAGYAIAYKRACATQSEMRSAWVRSVVLLQKDERFQRALAQDAWLAARLPPLLKQISDAGYADEHPPLFPTPAKFSAARHAATTMVQLRSSFDDRNWTALAEMEHLASVANAAGWTQVSPAVQPLLQGLPPGGEDRSGASLLVFLESERKVLAEGTVLESNWRSIQSTTASLQQSPEPAVRNLAADLKAEAAGSMRLDGDSHRLNILAAKCTELGNFTRLTHSRQAYDAFVVGMRTVFANHVPADLNSNLALLAEDVNVDLASVPEVQELSSKTQACTSLLDSMPVGDDAKQGLRQRLQTLLDAQQQLTAHNWVHAKKAELEQNCRSLGEQAAALSGDIKGAIVTTWIDQITHRSQAIAPDDSAWARQVQQLGAETQAMANRADLFERRQHQADAVLELLSQVNTALPTLAALPPSYTRSVQQRRIKELWLAMPPINLDETLPTAKDLIDVAMAQSSWSKEIGAFARDFPLVRPWTDLAGNDAVRLNWSATTAPADHRQFWEAEVLSAGGVLRTLPWLSHDLSRVDVLQATAEMSRAQRTRAVADRSAAPELALVARLRLEADTQSPWPATAEELTASAGWSRQLTGDAAKLKLDATELQTLTELQRAGWRRFVINADSPQMLTAAVATAGAFGVNLNPQAAVDLSALFPSDPVASYNLAVYLCHQPGAATSQARLIEAIHALPPADRTAAQLALDGVEPIQGDPLAQLKYKIGNDTWYRWPNQPFTPKAVPPPPPLIVQKNPEGNGGQVGTSVQANSGQTSDGKTNSEQSNGGQTTHARKGRTHTLVP